MCRMDSCLSSELRIRSDNSNTTLGHRHNCHQIARFGTRCDGWRGPGLRGSYYMRTCTLIALTVVTSRMSGMSGMILKYATLVVVVATAVDDDEEGMRVVKLLAMTFVVKICLYFPMRQLWSQGIGTSPQHSFVFYYHCERGQGPKFATTRYRPAFLI
jgi:hypothetical protein